MSEVLIGAAIGLTPALIWKGVGWLIARDRARVDEDRRGHDQTIRDIWEELNRVKGEQADLRAQVCSLPHRADIDRLDGKLDNLTRLILDRLGAPAPVARTPPVS